MHRQQSLMAGILALLAFPWSSAAVSTGVRCDGGIVSRGDRALVLEQRCGQPDVREPLRTLVVDGTLVVEYFERWYYNRGPNQLVRIVTLRNNRVDGFATGGSGYREFPARSCNPRLLRPGLSRLELLGICGAPESIDILPPYRYPGYRPGIEVLEPPREEWIYTFGTHRFSRIVTLVRGQVTKVESGPRLE